MWVIQRISPSQKHELNIMCKVLLARYGNIYGSQGFGSGYLCRSLFSLPHGIWFACHIINWFWVYNLMIFGKFEKLCNHKYHLLRTFSLSQRETLWQFVVTLSFCSQCQITPKIFLSLYICLFLIWSFNIVIYVILGQVSFT